MSLHDSIVSDIQKGLSNQQILKHLKSLPKYADMDMEALSTVISEVRKDCK